MAPRFIARQLSHPTGLGGRIIRFLMNRGNAGMNAFAVQQLELTSLDRVLEIGFGGGVALPSLIERAAFVAGVDRPHDVVQQAKAQFSKAVTASRAAFREGAVEALPFEAAAFDKVCTVNTVYFWRSLDAGCSEIHRVLAPGGCAVIGFLPKERMDRMAMPTDIFTARVPADVVPALAAAGFKTVQVTQPEPATSWIAVVARR
jgi:arsenite methyltransferase